MRITSTQLRQIIREELARSMNETDLQLAVPYIARKKKKKQPAPPRAPLGPMTDRMMKAESDRREKERALSVFAKDLSTIDADYVKDILPTVSGMYAPVTHIIDWAGPELRAKIEELALDYLKAHRYDSGNASPAEVEAAFEKFQEIVNQYATMRGRQDFLGTASRFAAGFGISTGLTPTTKESLKRR